MEIRSFSKRLTEDEAGVPLLLRRISPIKAMDAIGQTETIWTPANQMAVLFDKRESVIRKHINNVFDEGELSREINTQNMRAGRIYGDPFL